MVINIVRQIKLTEEKSKQSINEALKNAKQIVEDAKKHSEDLLKKTANEARDEKNELLRDASRRAQNEIISLKKGHELQLNKLHSLAKTNMKKAKLFVEKNLIKKAES